MKEKIADEMTDMYIFKEKVIKQLVKRDDEHTKQIIKDYVRNKYPKENIRIDFLDEYLSKYCAYGAKWFIISKVYKDIK